jgi:hypothetical protein
MLNNPSFNIPRPNGRIIITRMHKISMFLQHGIYIRNLTHVCVMKNSSSKLILCLQIWSIVQQYAYYICIISNGVKLELNLLLTSMLTSVNIFTNLVLFMAIAPCNLACIFMYIESGVLIP